VGEEVRGRSAGGQLAVELEGNAKARGVQAAEATSAFLAAATRFSSGTAARSRGTQQAAEARNSDANAADLKNPVACMKVRGHGRNVGG
jgi:hypothetical protein